MKRLLIVIALLCCVPSITLAQTYPLPNAEQQAGIDKDNSRHFGDSPKDGGPMAADISP